MSISFIILLSILINFFHQVDSTPTTTSIPHPRALYAHQVLFESLRSDMEQNDNVDAMMLFAPEFHYDLKNDTVWGVQQYVNSMTRTPNQISSEPTTTTQTIDGKTVYRSEFTTQKTSTRESHSHILYSSIQCDGRMRYIDGWEK